jgi:hypothetical protein
LINRWSFSFKNLRSSNALRQFLAAFPERNPETITIPEIEAFINQQVTHKNISASYQKQSARLHYLRRFLVC